MTVICSAGTYLPPWTSGDSSRRTSGPDEDALTMAVAAGRAADAAIRVERVVLVSRDMPLLEGGNGAALLAGLSLGADIPVREVLGGAPAALDEILAAAPGTVVIAADDTPTSCAAGAVVVSAECGTELSASTRQTRSLPVLVRRADGSRRDYADPRLERELGTAATLARLHLDPSQPVVAAAGVGRKQLARYGGANGDIAGGSAASLLHAVIGAIENEAAGLVLAAEQSSVTAAELTPGPTRICRDEPEPQVLPATVLTEGTGIPISLAAYARAFDPKLRWEAAISEQGSGVDCMPQFPPRSRVASDGTLVVDHRYEPLPRTGTVYTQTTVSLPVPDLASPYSLAVVQLDGSPVRALLKVTGVPAGEIRIGQPGFIVLRRIATRMGVPDYGHAFLPSDTTTGR